jgi:hypothetical protein
MGGRGHCSKKIPQATFLCVCVSPGMMNNQIKNVSLLLTVDMLLDIHCNDFEIKCN